MMCGGVCNFRNGRDETGLELTKLRRFVFDLGGNLRPEYHLQYGARAPRILPCTPPEPES
jgi:hypothetical protein